MVSSCKDLKDATAICLQRSPCVMIDRHTPKECLENDELFANLPELCVMQYFQYVKCKWGAADMRKRFRGNGPLSTGKYKQKLEELSTGHYDPQEEQETLRALTGAQVKEHVNDKVNDKEQ